MLLYTLQCHRVGMLPGSCTIRTSGVALRHDAALANHIIHGHRLLLIRSVDLQTGIFLDAVRLTCGATVAMAAE